MNGHAQPLNQSAAMRVRPHRGNVREVFQRHPITPATEPSIDGVLIPVNLRQSTPSRAFFYYPKDGREELSTGFGVSDIEVWNRTFKDLQPVGGLYEWKSGNLGYTYLDAYLRHPQSLKMRGKPYVSETVLPVHFF